MELEEKLKKAKDGNTSEEELKKLLVDENEIIKYAVISNPNFTEETQICFADDINTPVAILRALSNSNYEMVRNFIASNESCPLDLIEKFAEEKDALMGVASNKSTPSSIIGGLLSYDNGAYRELIADNPSTPLNILEKLYTSVDSNIRVNIASNPSTPQKILTILSDDKNQKVRCSLAVNKNLTAELFIKLSNDANSSVRTVIASNRNTPYNILEILVKEKEHDVFNAAKKTLNSKKSPSEIQNEQKAILEESKSSKSEIDDFLLI